MPDFKDDDFRRVSGEVVADSSDEDIDGVLFKVCMEYLVKKNLGLGSVLVSHFSLERRKFINKTPLGVICWSIWFYMQEDKSSVKFTGINMNFNINFKRLRCI